MPRIDADLKLDFKDVLLRPKRSSLKSRAEDVNRTCFTEVEPRIIMKEMEKGLRRCCICSCNYSISFPLVGCCLSQHSHIYDIIEPGSLLDMEPCVQKQEK